MCKSDKSRRIIRTLISVCLITFTLIVGYSAADAVGLFPFERKTELFPQPYLFWIGMVLAAVILAGIFFLYLQEPLGPVKRSAYRPFLIVSAVLAVICYLVLSLGMPCHVRADVNAMKTRAPSIFTASPFSGADQMKDPSILYKYTDGRQVFIDKDSHTGVNTLDLIVPPEQRRSERIPVLSQDEEIYLLQQEHYVADLISGADEEPYFLQQEQYVTGFASDAAKVVCIFGPFWKDSQDIYCVTGQSGTVYWIPAEAYTQCMDISRAGEIDPGLPAYDPIDPDTGNQTVPAVLLDDGRTQAQYIGHQTLFLLALYVLGALIVYNFGKNASPLLRAFLPFPVGCAVMVLYCLLLSFLNVRISVLPLSAFYAVMLAALLLRMTLKKLSAKGLLPSVVFLPILAILCIYFAYKQNYYASPDSAVNIFWGQRLLRFGGFAGLVGSYVAYGSFSVMLSAMGEALNFGLPYAVYPVMFVQVVLLTGTYCFLSTRYATAQKRCMAAVLAVLTAALLLTCKEYEYHKYWVLNNLPASVYLLVFTWSLLSIGKQDTNHRLNLLLCLLCGGLIMSTRTEGAIYLALLFALSLVADVRQADRTRVIAGLAVMSLLYNAGIWLYGREVSTAFWSAGKAALSVAALVGMLLINLLYGYLQKKKPAISNYAGAIFALIVVSMLVACCLLNPYRIAGENLHAILKHMTDRPLLPISAFLAVLFVLNFDNLRNKDNQTAVLMTLGYFVIVFCIFLFRMSDGLPAPLHEGHGDSGRRTLFQALPLFLSLLSSNVMDTVLSPGGNSPLPSRKN